MALRSSSAATLISLVATTSLEYRMNDISTVTAEIVFVFQWLSVLTSITLSMEYTNMALKYPTKQSSISLAANDVI